MRRFLSLILLLLFVLGIQGEFNTANSDQVLQVTFRDFLAFNYNGTILPPMVSPLPVDLDFNNERGDDTKIVTQTLQSNGLPGYAPPGYWNTSTTHGRALFTCWYSDCVYNRLVTGLNLTLTRESEFWIHPSFRDFYPLTGYGWGDLLPDRNGTLYNFCFTMQIGAYFVYSGGEYLVIGSDDDLFVYVNNNLTCNVGGVHVIEDCEIEFDSLDLNVGDEVKVDIFYADRHTPAASFNFSSNILFYGPTNSSITVSSITPVSTTGGVITIKGTGFQPINSGGVNVTIDGLPCTDVVVVDDSQLYCTASEGIGSQNQVYILIGNSAFSNGVRQDNKNAETTFSYSPPQITNISPSTNLPVEGGVTVDIFGSSFGSQLGNISVWIVDVLIDNFTYILPPQNSNYSTSNYIPLVCGNVTLIKAHTHISCVLPLGYGIKGVVIVVAGLQSFPFNISFAPPIIDSVSMLPTEGGVMYINGTNLIFSADSITIIFYFPMNNNSPQSKRMITYFESIEEITQCGDLFECVHCDSISIVVPYRSLACNITEGIGKDILGELTVDGETTAFNFSYLPPVVTSHSPIPLVGGDITIEGDNFGNNQNIQIYFQGPNNQSILCQNVSIITPHHEISCYLPPAPSGTTSSQTYSILLNVGGNTNPQTNQTNVRFPTIVANDYQNNGGSLITNELGLPTNFSVFLLKSITDSVTVSFTASPKVVTITPSMVTFTTKNWNVPQLIQVVGLPDSNNENGDIEFVINGISHSTDSMNDNVKMPSISGVNRNIVWPRITNINPEVSGINGTIVTITGNSFVFGNSTFHIYINNVEITNITYISSTQIVLQSPVVNDSLPRYVNTAIYNPDGGYTSCPPNFLGGATVSLDLPQCTDGGALYYAKDCKNPGEYGIDGDCKPCPKFARCPGGDRIWPDAGYWNPSENVVPIACNPSQACPGHNETPACNPGYVGAYCGTCADEYYRTSSGVCLPCSDTSQSVVTLILIIAGVYFGVLSIAVVFLHDDFLDTVVTLLIAVQQGVSIGSDAAAKLGAGAQRFFNYATLIQFDYNFLRPGCTIPIVSFPTIFGGTVLVVIVFALVYILGAFARAFILFGHPKGPPVPPSDDDLDTEVKAKRGSRASIRSARNTLTRASLRLVHGNNYHINWESLDWKESFYRRATRSILILLTIVYYIISYRTLQTLFCVNDGTGKMRLRAELILICYQGPHRVADSFAWIILVLYVIGFPIVCFWFIERAVKDGATKTANRHRFGFLYRGLRNSFWFRLIALLTSLAVAIEVTFGLNVTIQLFVNGLLFFVNLVILALKRPLEKPIMNTAYVVLGILRSIYLLVLMGKSSSGQPFEIALFVVSLIILVFVFVYFCWWLKRDIQKRRQEKQQEQQKKSDANELKSSSTKSSRPVRERKHKIDNDDDDNFELEG